MRDYILLYVNGKRHEIRGEKAFKTLANFLRHDLQMIGTKIVCEEGDCGSCTVLVASWTPDHQPEEKLSYKTINACIAPLTVLDCSSVVTVEGLSQNQDHVLKPTPVQEALATHHGSQCGFCTPGFVMSLTALFEEDRDIQVQDVKNACTGNLCRCTGYGAIIEGAMHVDRSRLEKIKDRYHSPPMIADFSTHWTIPVSIVWAQKMFLRPSSLEEVFLNLKSHPDMRIISGATDLGVLANKHKLDLDQSLSLAGLRDGAAISCDPQHITVGPLVTLQKFAQVIKDKIPELHRYLHLFASPQIKHMGTLVGNIANASPIGDSMPPLMVLGTRLLLVSQENPTGREVPLDLFYQGYKKVDLKPGELIWRVIIPLSPLDQSSYFRTYKVSRRKDLDISTVSAAFNLEIKSSQVIEARMAFGGIAPYPIRIPEMEKHVCGMSLSEASKAFDDQWVALHISPISDLRGTAEYRKDLISQLIKRFFRDLSRDTEKPIPCP
jgi:xanthine dehydrogenase small subunit